MKTSFAIYAGLSLFAFGLNAGQIVTFIEGGGKESRSATLYARRVDGTAMPVELPITVPGTTDVPLPDGLWELQIVGAKLWMTAVYLRNADSTSVRLWPTVPVAGTSNGAKTLRALFTPHDPNGQSGEVECDTDRDAWTCWMPAGLYDLRFSSRGSAPEFRFGVAVPAKDRQTGLRLHFVPGASLSGRVEAVRGANISVEEVEVSLTPASGDNATTKQAVRTDAKGFFQFKSLAPGDYSIRAGKKGLAAQTGSVKILAGVAAELNAPLLLDTPKRLRVTVMPPVDPADRPWRVTLSSNDRRLRRGDVLAESQTSAAGEWASPPLVAGDYTVDVRTTAAEKWKSEDVTIGRDDVTIAVAALPAKVTGVVTLGDRPLQAQISFGGEWGVKLHSDADGRFAGDVPPADGEEQVVLVEADTPRVKRTIRTKIERRETGELRLIIDLPTTTLMGRVLKEDRSPAPHAMVTVTGEQPDTFEQTFTDLDGSFQLAGFERANYKITAYAPEHSSKSLGIELLKDQVTEVELILEREEHVTGRMTMGDVPVIAADVYAFPRDAWGPTIPHAVTNESGFFQLTLPPGTTRFDVFAVHPAFDTTFGRTTLKKDKELQVRTNQIGGTIVVEWKSDDFLLTHHGSEMTANWLVYQSGAMKAPDRMTVPRLEPGQYSACTMDKTRCVSGYLPPHGTLTLTLSSAAAD